MATQSATQSASPAGHTPTGRGISLEAYQAIRSAVAEEVALRRNTDDIQFTAAESGASTVRRERAGGGEHLREL